MGHELWISPITGYRRKGTRLAELPSLLGSGITAHTILEPLQSCPADAAGVRMAQILRRRDFDVAGVRERPDGPVVGFVERASLTGGIVRDHLQPVTAALLVSDATGLPSVLSVLRGRPYTFVLVGPEVRGIVTRADLNKPPVRVYLFGLISLLEMHLRFWVRAAYGGDSWKRKLSSARLKAAEDLQTERRGRNQETGLIDCLQFCDKRDLVLACKDLRDRLCLGTKSSARRHLARAEDLRNLLAHSHQDVAQGSSWEDVIDLVQWLETIVHTSDERVEEAAKNSAQRDEDGLWASA
jgi:hypothetical protein